jgi:cytochrome c oxidase subunit 4
VLDLLAVFLDSPGPKGFFENAAFLIGLPLVVLGVAGLLVALSPIELRWPQPPSAEAVAAAGHPSAAQYVRVGVILAIVTLVEVALYYTNITGGAMLFLLLTLSAVKFVLVVLWFMHLAFDSRIFSILFGGGMALVVALFLIVLATLGASLV